MSRTRFMGFDDSALSSMLESAGLPPEAEGLARRVADRMLESHDMLLESAYGPDAPITRVEAEVAALVDAENAKGVATSEQIVTLASASIDAMLAADGFEPVMTETFEFGPRRIPGRRTFYVQPPEVELLRALGRQVPVVLATTADPYSFVKSTVAHYLGAQFGSHRRVLLWTIASGLFELVLTDGGIKHVEAGSKHAYESPQYEVTTLSEYATNIGIAVSEARNAAVSMASDFGKASDGDEEFRYFATDRTPDSRTPRFLFIVDDTDDEGNARELTEQVRISAVIDGAPRLLARRANADQFRGQGITNVLSYIATREMQGALYIVCDAEVLFEQSGPLAGPTAIGAAHVRDASVRLRRADKGTQILLLSSPVVPPRSLAGLVAHVDIPLPSRREFIRVLRKQLSELPIADTLLGAGEDPLHASDSLRGLSEAALGMSLSEANAAIAEAVALDAATPEDLLKAIFRSKRISVRSSAALELIERLPPTDLMLGGMERFWMWLESRHKAFTQREAAREFGIDRRPKGVLILGVPGTGKSLAAKLIAREWKLPLVRLDMGAVQNMWHGASEERIRFALKTVEAMSPCVLWIDEIDKGIAQGEGHASSSTDLNVRATLLTWLQENDSAVFVVATANRFGNLPPELTRAGRFDARFFFGCPKPEGRAQILKIHLTMRRVTSVDELECQRLAAKMHGFTGAEIEQAVLDGLFAAFARGSPPQPEDFVEVVARVKPIIRAAGKGLDEIWALIEEGRVELASDRFLSRADVTRLIDPELFSPMYCRLDRISGWEAHGSRAERILMRDQYGLRAAVVLGTGDDRWIYLHTNFRLDPSDMSAFKVLDELDTIGANGVMDTLITQGAIETVWFENDQLLKRFTSVRELGAYAELYRVLPVERAARERAA